MSVDVATLVFAFVSDSAVVAADRQDRLIAQGEILEKQQRNVRRATDSVTEGHKAATGQIERRARATVGLAQAGGAVEKAAAQEAAAWARVEASISKRNAALRGDVAATGLKAAADEAKAWAKVEDHLERRNAKLRGDLAAEEALATMRAADQEAEAWAEVEAALRRRNYLLRENLAVAAAHEAARAAQTEAAAWSSVEAALERRNAEFRQGNLVAGLKAEAAAAAELQRATATLRASVDPVATAQGKLNAELREADRLFAAGAISGGEYGRAVTVLNGRLAALNVSHVAAGKGATLQAHELTNLGQQFADIGVSLASGQALWLVAIQQGAQIVPIWGEASARGATLGATIKQVTGAVLGFTAAMAPLLIAVGAAGGAFLLWRKYVDDSKAALAATSKATQGAAEAQREYRSALVSAIDFAEKYKIANNGVTAALDGVLASQSATYRQTLASVDANDAAGRAALRRAELERVLTVELLKQAALKARERADESDEAAKKARGAATMSGSFAAFAFSGGTNAFDLAAQQQAIKFRELGGEAAKKAAAEERAYANSLDAMAKAYQTATLTIPPNTAAKTANTAATREAKKATDELGDTPEGAAAPRDRSLEAAAEVEALIGGAMADELQARLALAKDATARATIERQLVQEQLRVEQAQIDKKIASINASKGLEAGEKALLTFQLEAVQAMNERAAALKSAAISEAEQAALAAQGLETQQGNLRNQIDLLSAQANVTKSAFARAVIERDILKAQQALEKATLRAVTVANGATAAAEADAQRRLAVLNQIQELELAQANQQTRLVNAITEAADAVDGFRSAFKRNDFGGVLDNLQRVIGTIRGSFEQYGMTGGLMTAGSAAASLIGGKTGRAVGRGLGIASMGMSLGSSAGMLGSALSLGGSLSSLGTLGIGSALSTIAPMLGPIGLAVGALYAAAKLLNVGGKPSNKGAGVDLGTGALSGNRRSEETEQAALAAADTIKAAQGAMKTAGITLGATVNGLVIGTRDLSQIYLSNGKTLTSAVGDSAAAVDAAMRGILDGATFQSEAQKKLVDSAIAAGKGFEELAAILDTYAQAQKLAASIDDQILQLTDPKAFDLQAVTRDIQAQRDAAKELERQGYLTADQLAAVTAKLATLEGLQTVSVLERYGAANDNLATATENAEAALMNAYQAFSQAKQAEISAARQTADALKSFRQELTIGALAGRDPISQYAATKREFDRLNALATNDPERVANLASVGRAFVEASRAASPTQLAFERDLAAVRRASEASERAASDQANLAQAQLDAATAQLTALGLLNATSIDMATALKAYLAARDAQSAAKTATGAANSNTFDVARYLANSPDLEQNWREGGNLRRLGATLEEAASAHYEMQGKGEIAAGLRKYAAGGDHPGGFRLVGEEGPEIEATGPSRIYSARETARMLGGDSGEVVAELRALRAQVAKLTNQQAEDNRQIKRNTKDSADVLNKVSQGSDSLRTKDAA